MSGTDRNALRRQLLANGYEPLPLRGKACYVKGWSFAEIDAAFLREHARKAAWSNTGIRCGNVVAVDVDINGDLAAEAEQIIEATIGRTSFCRFGRGEKRLLVYWTDAPMRKLRTGAYAGPDGETYQIEVLGRGCQFAAFGVHPDAGTPYEWIDASPLTHDVDALPSVTPEQLEALVETLDAWLAGKGLELKSRGGEGDPSSNHDYCLTDDMQFDVIAPPLGLMSVAELKAQLPRRGTSWACHLTAIRPDSDSGAGRVHYAPSGRFCIADFARGVTYFEAPGLDEMGAELARLLDAPADGGMFGPAPGAAARSLVDTYFFLESDNTVRRLDAPHDAVAFGNFSNSRGRRNVLTWIADPRTRKARHMQFRPDRPPGLFDEGGETLVNGYVPPPHPEEGGDAKVFTDFIRHLVPARAERELTLDWIASKVQRPWIPGHGLIMVAARTQGTGRGTLAKILAKLIGYHQEVPFKRIVGQEYQSQYNDFLSGRLLISVPEALDSLDYASRRNAYEALKELVDPSAREMTITRKGIANRPELVYASFFFATNHGDALPIDDSDRRFLVVDNGPPLPVALAERVYAWMARPENIGALWRELRARRVSYDPLAVAPVTAAKTRMIEATTSDISHAWADFVALAPGAVATFEQWRAYALSRRDEMDFPSDSVKRDDGLRRVFRAGSEAYSKPVKLSGKAVRVRILRDAERWRDADSGEVRVELELNGAVKSGAASRGAGVVDFPSR